MAGVIPPADGGVMQWPQPPPPWGQHAIIIPVPQALDNALNQNIPVQDNVPHPQVNNITDRLVSIQIPYPNAWRAVQYYQQEFNAGIESSATRLLPLLYDEYSVYNEYVINMMMGQRFFISDAFSFTQRPLVARSSNMVITVPDPFQFVQNALNNNSRLLRAEFRLNNFCELVTILDPFFVTWTFVVPAATMFPANN